MRTSDTTAEPPGGEPGRRHGTVEMPLPEASRGPAENEAAQTRLDLPLPEIPAPRPPAGPVPGRDEPALPAAQDGDWHRFHYAIAVFLLAYGVTGLLAGLIGWTDHRREIADQLGETVGAGAATVVLVLVKAVQALLTVTVLAGLLRRKDVWLLPALAGWIAGFAGFCVLDVWAGSLGRLLEHVLYLVVLTVLLMTSYTLSVKVRAGRRASGGEPEPPAGRLGRTTQEMALAVLDRWQRVRPQAQPARPENPPDAPPPA